MWDTFGLASLSMVSYEVLNQINTLVVGLVLLFPPKDDQSSTFEHHDMFTVVCLVRTS